MSAVVDAPRGVARDGGHGGGFDADRHDPHEARDWAAFWHDGYLRLGALGDPADVAALGRRVDDLMLGVVRHEGVFFQLDAPSGRYEDLTYGLGFQGPSLDYRKLEKLELDPLFWRFVSSAPFERVCRRLIDGPIALQRACVFNKSARGGSDLPFHQDGGKFWGLDRDPFVQIWTALDDAPVESGCLEVVPGTHVAGLVTPLGGVVPRAALEAADVERHAVPLPARAGESVLLHNHVWHRSGTNATGRPRRALTVCYMDASTRCTRTRRAPRVFRTVFA